MLKQRKGLVGAMTTPNYSDNSVRIEAGSVVIGNSWVNYNAALFKLTDYISSVVKPPRTRFFKNRGYAVYLLVGLDINEGIKVVEGRHVPFTTVWSVPRPETHDLVPLVGVVVVQNGSNDLNNGYLPLKDEYVEFFNGMGNVVDSDLMGITGVNCDVAGATGALGYTGLAGEWGASGWEGDQGHTGAMPPVPQGETGLQGMTGINWQIHVPLETFFYA